MVASPEVNRGERAVFGEGPLLAFVLRPAPVSFTVPAFAVRICQHAVIYGGILCAAVAGCLLIYAPLETAAIAVGLIALVGSAVYLATARPMKARLLVAEATLAVYIVGAGAVLKVLAAITGIAELFKRVVELLHGF